MIPSRLLVTTVFTRFAKDRAESKRANTIRNDRGFLRFCEAASCEYVNQIDRAAAQRYEAARLVAPTTKRLELKVTKVVLDWCVDHKLLRENPLAKYRCESTNADTNPHRAFSLDELNAILSAAYPPLDLMVKIYAVTGLRRTELCSITWGDVDLDEGIIRLSGSITKTKVGRFAVLGPKLVELLREHQGARADPPAHPGSGALVFPTRNGTSMYSTVWQSFTRACRRAGIDMAGAHPHSLRVTCATLLYMELGAPSAVVDLILGHGVVKDPKAPLSIRKYLKARPEMIRPWIVRLEELILEGGVR